MSNDLTEPNDRLLCERQAERLNNAFQALAAGRLMQNDRPFTADSPYVLAPHVTLCHDLAPRDIDIIADIFEAIERGERSQVVGAPGPGQLTTSLPVG